MKKWILVYSFLLLGLVGYAQTNPADSIPDYESLAMDTSIDYDDLLNELDSFIDSLLAPRSYFLGTVSAAKAYYNFLKGDTAIESRGQLRISPTIGYYHKTGIGLTLSGDLTDNGRSLDLYQYTVTPSFDLIQNVNWTGGVSYTRYFTKDELPFYTTPIQNEVGAYFLLRKTWLQPGVTVNYGWGSRTDVEERIVYIEPLLERKRLRRHTGILSPAIRDSLISLLVNNIIESGISDFSVSASVRHNFYWLNLSKHHDYIKFTPLLTCSFGSQKFGFNQVTSFTQRNNNTNTGVRNNVRRVTLDDRQQFQPLSLTLYLKPEYCIGKFFIQPQFILDYYFPAKEENLTALFSLNAGFMF
jgi:hypothetical protein